MELQSAIEKSEQWMIKASLMCDGIEIDSSARSRIPATLFHLCVEHQQGIYTLTKEGLLGSAFALLRPQFEAYVRGVWYHHCASESKLDSFLNGAEPPKINELLIGIGSIPDFDYQILLETKKSIWPMLNDFTHGGSVQVRARMTANEIVKNYKIDHVAGMLNWSSVLSFMGYVGMANIAKDVFLANNLIDCIHSIYADILPSIRQP